MRRLDRPDCLGEVYAPSGELVFETDDSDGQSIEWPMVNQKGERVSDGVYLATITVTDMAGKRRKRIEQITVSTPQGSEQSSSTALMTEPPTPQAAATITGAGTGTATSGNLARFTGASTIGNSIITQSATNNIGINAPAPTATLLINKSQPAPVATSAVATTPLLQTIGGAGGNTTGTTGQQAGAGASIALTAGNGGTAPAGSKRGSGGNITLQPGSGGAGAGTAGVNGNVLIAPSGVGNVGIGTGTPTSRLTVNGGVQILGVGNGIKFPDGSIQTKAATSAGGLSSVTHNATLAGAGTAASPLGVAVPLTLSGATNNAALTVNNSGNTSGGGVAINGNGTNGSYGVQGSGLIGVNGLGGSSGTGVSGSSTGGGTGVLGRSGTGYAGDFQGRVHATGLATFDGKVGIGILNPIGRLQVEGGGNIAVYGTSTTGTGVSGSSGNGYGIYGFSDSGDAVYGQSTTGYAGDFHGKVKISEGLAVTGGCTGCSPPSDRSLKANISKVNPRIILSKLASVPIQTWNYKFEPETVRHMGAMAQDFRAAFNLGADDKTLNTVDAQGVTMAAIQGLYQQNQELASEVRQLRAQLQQQQAQLNQVKRTIKRKRSARK